MTPQEAHKIGSDYIVVGRPIIQAENPWDAYHEIKRTVECVRATKSETFVALREFHGIFLTHSLDHRRENDRFSSVIVGIIGAR